MFRFVVLFASLCVCLSVYAYVYVCASVCVYLWECLNEIVKNGRHDVIRFTILKSGKDGPRKYVLDNLWKVLSNVTNPFRL